MGTVLNDLSRVTRRMAFAQAMAGGMMIGPLFIASLGDRLALLLALVLAGLVLFIAASIAFIVVTRRGQSRLVADVVAASQQIVRGTVGSEFVPARTVRRRIAKSTNGFLASQPQGLDGPSCIVVATALAADGARRVAFLTPASIALNLRRAPVALRLHPTVRDAAVLDDVLQPGQLDEIEADQRWESEKLPTDRSVCGGWTAVAVSWFLGLAAGCGVVTIAASVLT